MNFKGKYGMKKIVSLRYITKDIRIVVGNGQCKFYQPDAIPSNPSANCFYLAHTLLSNIYSKYATKSLYYIEQSNICERYYPNVGGLIRYKTEFMRNR